MRHFLSRFTAVALLIASSSATLAGEVSIIGEDAGLTLLGEEIERHAAAAQGTVGVAVYHLESGRGLLLNGDASFPMASTYKVPIAVEILARVDDGSLSLDERITVQETDLVNTHGVISDLLDAPGAQLTIENLLGLMLRISDNIATDLLFREAGGASAINARIKKLGIEGMRVDRDTRGIIASWLGSEAARAGKRIPVAEFDAMVDAENLGQLGDEELDALNREFNADPSDSSTPKAMSALLQGLWEQTHLSKKSSALILEIMERCQTGERRLVGLLPAGTVVAHKTGTIGETTNDVGIITLPNDAGHVICVVFIKESKLPDNAAMEPVIAQIARATHDYFVFNRRSE